MTPDDAGSAAAGRHRPSSTSAPVGDAKGTDAMLHQVFDPRRNALNAIRLGLATGVMLWHSFPLTGNDLSARPLIQLLGLSFVDGFFAISGFLIVSSWMRRPEVRSFVTARLLRILPAFYCCLIVTAFVFAPLSALLVGDRITGGIMSSGFSYVVRNALVQVNQYGIDGTLTDVAHPDAWNGSLWTLKWELLCYLGVLILGLTRLLRFRATLPALFVLSLGVLIGSATIQKLHSLDDMSRFAVMFLAGALIWQFQHRLRVTWGLISAAIVVVVACSFLPDYRVVAALPLAYAVIGAGALLKNPRLHLRNDISYGMYIYAFPVQQTIAVLGGAALGVAGYFVVSAAATVPLAALSWFVVEKRALRFKPRPKVSQWVVADRTMHPDPDADDPGESPVAPPGPDSTVRTRSFDGGPDGR